MRRLTSVSYPDTGSDAYCYTDTSTTSCSSTVIPSFVFTKAIGNGVSPLVETGIVDGLGRKIETQLLDPSGADYTDTYPPGEHMRCVANIVGRL